MYTVTQMGPDRTTNLPLTITSVYVFALDVYEAYASKFHDGDISVESLDAFLEHAKTSDPNGDDSKARTVLMPFFESGVSKKEIVTDTKRLTKRGQGCGSVLVAFSALTAAFFGVHIS